MGDARQQAGQLRRAWALLGNADRCSQMQRGADACRRGAEVEQQAPGRVQQCSRAEQAVRAAVWCRLVQERADVVSDYGAGRGLQAVAGVAAGRSQRREERRETWSWGTWTAGG